MTGERPPGMGEQTCRELVELVTAYLDDALPPDLRALTEDHLNDCEGCRNVLAQLRTVVSLAGQRTEADIEGIDPLARDRITATFRRLRRR